MLIRTALTLLDVPHLALGAELTPEYDERTRVVMVRSLVGMVGTASVALLYYVAFDAYKRRFPDAPDVRLMTEPYAMFGLVAGIACAVCIVITVVGTRRAIPWLVEPRSGEKTGSLIGEAFRDMAGTLRLPTFRALVLVVTLVTTASAFIPMMLTHLAVYFWHVDFQVQSSGMFHLALGTGVGMAYWRQRAARWDKKPALLAGMACGTFFTVVPPLLQIAGLVPHEAFWMLTFYNNIHLLMGFGFAAMAVLGASMMADVSDQDELDLGLRRQGIFFGAFSFVNKVAHGVGAALAGALYGAVGLTKGMAPADAPAAAGTQMALGVSLLIVILAGAGTVFLRHYDLSRERHEEIRSALQARAATPRSR